MKSRLGHFSPALIGKNLPVPFPWTTLLVSNCSPLPLDQYLTAVLLVQVKLLLPKRRLKPRTFRAAAGQTVFVGGVARIDVQSSPGATLYLTVWASDDLTCHFGKTDGANER